MSSVSCSAGLLIFSFFFSPMPTSNFTLSHEFLALRKCRFSDHPGSRARTARRLRARDPALDRGHWPSSNRIKNVGYFIAYTSRTCHLLVELVWFRSRRPRSEWRAKRDLAITTPRLMARGGHGLEMPTRVCLFSTLVTKVVDGRILRCGWAPGTDHPHVQWLVCTNIHCSA